MNPAQEVRAGLRALAQDLRDAIDPTTPHLVPFALLGVPLLARALGAPPGPIDAGRRRELEATLRALLPPLGRALDASAPDRRAAIEARLGEAGRTLPLTGTPLAWLHQYIREGAGDGVAPGRGNKITGAALLTATQFFTPLYMVRHLLARGLEALQATRPGLGLGDVVVLDPAAGGGNFLTEALEASAGAGAAGTVVGFELDPELATIAALNVVLTTTLLTGAAPTRAPTVLSGDAGDERGFLTRAAADRVRAALPPDRPVLLAANPPFLGRRLMSDPLREWLGAEIPDAKGDLCVAFLERSLAFLRPGDAAAFVHQTSWMHLSSFRAFRRRLFDRFDLVDCAELGPNAFADLSGEKTTVALSVLTPRTDVPRTTRFHRLVHLGAAETEAALATPSEAHRFDLTRGRLEPLIDGGLAYHVSSTLSRRAAAHPTYGELANPMQGTSTGDNKTFVRFAWEVGPRDVGWRRVSKGGGYSKWVGLNRYRVLWGEGGRRVRENPGSAPRNLDRLAATQLVYSDTGNRGLNVRLRRPDQVVIASGPGIEVRVGDPLVHMAWLNSRLATFLLKSMTPKLTVSAGYIKRLPFAVPEGRDDALRERAREALALKEAELRDRLADDEYVHRPPAGGVHDDAPARLIEALGRELERLRVEARIEARVEELFGLSAAGRAEVVAEIGPPAATLRGAPPPSGASELDAQVAALLDAAGRFGGRRRPRRGAVGSLVGREGVLEELAVDLRCDPAALLERIAEAVDSLPMTRAVLEHDLRHRLVLHELGYRAGEPPPGATRGIDELAAALGTAGGDSPAEARAWLRGHLVPTHGGAFYKRPFLTVDGDVVRPVA